MNDLMHWRTEGEFEDEIAIEILAGPDEDAETVCEVEPFTGDWTEKEVARVHLMTSAPELFNALRMAEALVTRLVGAADHYSDELLKMRRAIAHAEGRA